MKLNEAFPSAFLKASDLEDGDRDLVIKAADIESIGQGKDAEDKLVIKFRNEEKKLVCNRTNANMIASLLKSDDTDDWVGKKITLTTEMVAFGGKTSPAIRVAGKLPGAAKPATTASDDAEKDEITF